MVDIEINIVSSVKQARSLEPKSLGASSPLCFMQLIMGWGTSKHNCLCILFFMMTRSRWKFRIGASTSDHTLYSSPHYAILRPEDGPQWPKHVVCIINRIQRQLCFDVPTLSPNQSFDSAKKKKIVFLISNFRRVLNLVCILWV